LAESYNFTFRPNPDFHSLPLANRIRIIGGQWRGRRLHFPADQGVRPTPDRVRETLFNWLGQDLTGASTLELFGGSGALSLEALSRGAALAVTVDRNPLLVSAIIAAGAALGTDRLEARCADAYAFFTHERRLFDVIFLDPPFGKARWPELLGQGAARLAPDGAVYVEAREPIIVPPNLAIVRRHKAGQVHYHLLRRAPA